LLPLRMAAPTLRGIKPGIIISIIAASRRPDVSLRHVLPVFPSILRREESGPPVRLLAFVCGDARRD